MIRRLLKRDYGGLIAFVAVLAIFLYVLNGLLPLVANLRIPVIGPQQRSQRVELVETLAEPTATPAPSPTVAIVISPPEPTPTNTSVPTPTPEIRKVGNTGGLGVYVRRTPNINDRIRAWLDNSEMILLGEETDAGGFHWVKVRDPAGNEGWVPDRYLVRP